MYKSVWKNQNNEKGHEKYSFKLMQNVLYFPTKPTLTDEFQQANVPNLSREDLKH